MITATFCKIRVEVTEWVEDDRFIVETLDGSEPFTVYYAGAGFGTRTWAVARRDQLTNVVDDSLVLDSIFAKELVTNEIL